MIQNPKSELKTRCLILLPPFIAQALMAAMPTLSCKAVLETVMATIGSRLLIKQLTNHNALQGDFWGKESMIHIACTQYIQGLHDYETLHI
jgi:hypothetical protein